MASKVASRKSKAKVLRRDAEDNRERLLLAAEQVFTALGTAATMDDIARAADVGPATLYRRFPSKDGLAKAVLERFFERLVGLADSALQEPPRRCVEAYLTTVAFELASKRGLAHGLWGDLAPRGLVAELEDRTKRLVGRAQSVGAVSAQLEVGDIAAAVWALRGIFQVGGASADTAWRRHVAFLLAGFRAGRPREASAKRRPGRSARS